MKQIKLEVGKTYRNRRGEEVRIVRKDNASKYPYQGSDLEWYVESGQWCNMGDLYDLVEEVPSETTRHTFQIPDGVKEITLDYFGNRIVVEMVPEKDPKPGVLREGDVVFEDGRIMIVKTYPNFYHAMFYPKYGKLFINALYGIPFTSSKFRPATPEEAQPLWDALKKAGKRWNPETMQVEDVPERERIMDFVQSYVNNVTWSHEQLCELVESYLKQKEGEK